MKKIAMVLVMVFVAASLFAAPLPLGEFPSGRWLDKNYDAIWEFSSHNIRILGLDGRVHWDFSTKTVENLRQFLDGDNPTITFSCPEAERSYRLSVVRPENHMSMEFDKKNFGEYRIMMPRH